MSSSDQVAELIAALQLRFAPRWQIAVPGKYLRMSYRETATTVRPPRRQVSAAHLVNAIGGRFAEAGVPQSSLLPICCGRDTDLTISAIQGLDPWLKDGADRVWREGYLAQPVVRLNGERDDQGRLREGFLTAFVNLSSVTRIGSVERHVGLLDAWIGALSAIGIHASRLTIHGNVEVWQRGPVSGITLFCDCDGRAVSDAVLLWHAADPSRMASDIGSGLERLRWLLSSCSWAETTFGPAARYCSVDVLDAVRAATLLVMSGVRPGHQGAGYSLRRLLQRIPPSVAAAGLGRLVRQQRGYWAQMGVTGSEWPQVSMTIEDGVLAQEREGQVSRRSP